MAFCKNCGKQLEYGVKFCDGCGTATVETIMPSNQRVQVTNIWQGYLSFWKNYANFNGRARRTEYWGASLFNGIIGVIGISILDVAIFGLNFEDFGPLYWLYVLAIFIPNSAIAWRRLHDIGKCGANYLWCLTIIGIIPVLIWLCQDSTPGENRFGENPKGVYNIKEC